MSSEAVLEIAFLAFSAIALGLVHVWHCTRAARRKAEAEEALRLDAIRQDAVKQLRAEHRAWSVAPVCEGADVMTMDS